VIASIWAFGGLIVWSAYFLVVYCSAAVLCAAGLAEGGMLGLRPIVLVTVAATILALLALGMLARWPAGQPPREAIADHDADRFLIWQTRAVTLLSAVGVLFVAGAVVVLGGSCR
jgi:hypothetical protein